VFTKNIIEHMTTQDHLDVVEYDKVFYDMLVQRFGTNKNVRIFNCSIADFKPEIQYDCIVSGLPFNSFLSELVKSILNVYQQILKPQGTIAYFEYIALPVVKQVGLLFASVLGRHFQQKRKDFLRTLSLVKAFRNSFQSQNQASVGMNMPPARAVTCRYLGLSGNPLAAL